MRERRSTMHSLSQLPGQIQKGKQTNKINSQESQVSQLNLKLPELKKNKNPGQISITERIRQSQTTTNLFQQSYQIPQYFKKQKLDNDKAAKKQVNSCINYDELKTLRIKTTSQVEPIEPIRQSFSKKSYQDDEAKIKEESMNYRIMELQKFLKQKQLQENKLKKEVEDMKKEKKDMKKEVEDMKNQHKQQKQKMEEKHKQTIQKHIITIQQLQLQLNKTQQQKRNIQNEKKQIINKLQQDKTYLNYEIKEKEKQLEQSNNKIQKLEDKVNNLQSQLYRIKLFKKQVEQSCHREKEDKERFQQKARQLQSQLRKLQGFK